MSLTPVKSLLKLFYSTDSGSKRNKLTVKELFTIRNCFRFFLFLFIVWIATMTCFFKSGLVQLQLFPGSIARTRIKSLIPFYYYSKIRTDALREERRRLVAPVFRINDVAVTDLKKNISKLQALLTKYNEASSDNYLELYEIREYIKALNERYSSTIGKKDIDLLLQNHDISQDALQRGTEIAVSILQNGIFDPSKFPDHDEDFINHMDVEGASMSVNLRPLPEAKKVLQKRLSEAIQNADVNQAIFRILRQNLVPNLIFDEKSTMNKTVKVDQHTPKVEIRRFAGDTLIETGTTISSIECELLAAYRKALIQSGLTPNFIHDEPFLRRFIVTFFVLFLTLPFLRIIKPLPNEMWLIITSFFINLWFTRISLEYLCSLFTKDIHFLNAIASALPYCIPIIVPSVLNTVLVRSSVGIIVGTSTACLCSLMLFQSLEYVAITFAAVFCGVYFARCIDSRGKIVLSCLVSGTILCLGLLITTGVSNFQFLLVQAITITVLNTFYGTVIVFLLPFIEQFFKCYSNIRYIEISDQRHPFLFQFRTIAPGSFQHSLTVANLAEKAATSIQANPYLCRAMSLYHDIGKVTRPQFFTENQNLDNPHDHISPFLSAVILRGHVSDGVEIAEGLKLPPKIVNAIREHHGTSLMYFFYTKAQELGLSGFSRSSFQYKGPCPRSRESMIISLADSLEAASRSLSNPTAESIRYLIKNIFDSKAKEGQFDNSLLSMRDISSLKESFFVSMLSIFHDRVNYHRF